MEFDKIILGENRISSFNSRETKNNNMILAIGATGAGKSERLVKPQILHSENNNLIVSFAKTNDITNYEKALTDKGYNVYIIDFTNPDNSNIGFDPLDFVETEDEIKRFAKMLSSVNENKAEKDPYWINSCTTTLTAMLSLLYERHKFEEYNKPSMNELFSYYEELEIQNSPLGGTMTTLDGYFEKVYSFDENSLAYRNWRSLKGLATKTSGCVYSIISNSIEAILTKSTLKIADMEKRISIDTFTKEKSALFLVTSPVDKNSNKYVDLFYSILFAKLFETAKQTPLERPLHIICDDFACTSQIMNFENYISIFRSLNISVEMVLQSLSQLSYMYGPDASNIIIDNCDRIVFLGSSSIKTCEEIAKRCNKTLYNIINLPTDLSIVFEKGQKPSMAKKYNTYEDEIYKKYFS